MERIAQVGDTDPLYAGEVISAPPSVISRPFSRQSLIKDEVAVQEPSRDGRYHKYCCPQPQGDVVADLGADLFQ